MSDELDNILFFQSEPQSSNMLPEWQIKQAKQQINAYILAEVLKLLGQDEKYTVVGHTYNGLGEATEHIGDGEAEWKDPRNELRKELRQALIVRFGPASEDSHE